MRRGFSRSIQNLAAGNSWGSVSSSFPPSSLSVYTSAPLAMSDTLSEKHEDFQIDHVEIRESGTDEAGFLAREKRLLRKIDWHLLPFLS